MGECRGPNDVVNNGLTQACAAALSCSRLQLALNALSQDYEHSLTGGSLDALPYVFQKPQYLLDDLEP